MSKANGADNPQHTHNNTWSTNSQPSVYKCGKCPREFTTPQAMLTHESQDHSKASQPGFEDMVRGLPFSSTPPIQQDPDSNLLARPSGIIAQQETLHISNLASKPLQQQECENNLPSTPSHIIEQPLLDATPATPAASMSSNDTPSQAIPDRCLADCDNNLLLESDRNLPTDPTSTGPPITGPTASNMVPCPWCSKLYSGNVGLGTHKRFCGHKPTAQSKEHPEPSRTVQLPQESATSKTQLQSTGDTQSNSSPAALQPADVNTGIPPHDVTAYPTVAGSTARSTQEGPFPASSTSDTAPTPTKTLIANLPAYAPTSITPTGSYNGISGEDFVTKINQIYDNMVRWRKNLFQVPSGLHGKSFIKLKTDWLKCFNNNTDFQGIALKVFMILPSLLLQKPSKTSKAKDHTKCLGERLKLWNEGKLDTLMKECQIIQRKIKTSKNRSSEDVSRIFSRLMFVGKVSAALKFLDKNSENGVLEPTEEVITLLHEKHPEPAAIQPGTLFEGPLQPVSPAHFSDIDEQTVMKAALRTKGSAGPSHFDSDQFSRILCSKHFKQEGKELREQISSLARKIATETIDPTTLEAYTSCRLISLNKNPGLRPIGIGEVLRRIVGKTIAWSVSDEIQEAAGPLQVSSGLKGGAEAAIHAMRDVFEADTTDAVILVDASNAFNNLNRQAALHNIRYICPPLSQTLINTYRKPARLFIGGGKEIMSSEGTTQGDPLAMQFYALGTNPLLRFLQSKVPEVSQVWLADDATGAGKLPRLREWWDLVITEGVKLGYHVNESKSWLILKNPNEMEAAKRTFEGSHINMTTSGKRHLGAALGSQDFKTEYITEKVNKWCSEIKQLAEIAQSQPHAAYSAYTHGMQHKFRYFLRTIEGIQEQLKPLDDVITNILVPAICGFKASEAGRSLLSLPVKAGGLGIGIVNEDADEEYRRSKAITGPLATIIALQGDNMPNGEEESSIKASTKRDKNIQLKERIAAVDESLAPETRRIIHQCREPGASNWLSALPLEKHGFNLNKSEFRDALALRYNQHINNLPSFCACGDKFGVTHAMNCKKGGFVNARHDNIRDFESSLLSKVCNDVETEPHLQPITSEQLPRSANTDNNARLDIRARGFWRRGQNAFFDVRVTNADAASQSNSTIKSVLKKHEQEKKRAYNQRVMQVEQGTFTPLVFTVAGSMGPECSIFHKNLAEKISNKTGEKYTHIINYIRCKISFMTIRSALLCLRGSRGPSKTAAATETGNDFLMYNLESGL